MDLVSKKIKRSFTKGKKVNRLVLMSRVEKVYMKVEAFEVIEDQRVKSILGSIIGELERLR